MAFSLWSSMIKDFGSTAEKLSGNPLGIIALFIVLLYGIAGFVLSSSAEFLSPDERLPIIWFLVIFPFLVLFVFSWLVSQHHTKLYAPKDYLSDETFLKAMSPQEVEEKHIQELEIYTGNVEGNLKSNRTESKPDSKLAKKPASSFLQDIRLADDLAMKYVKSKYKVDLLENQEIRRGKDGVKVDGVAVSKNNIAAFEFHLLNADSLNKNLNNRMADIAYTAMKLASYSENKKTKLIYVAIVKGLNISSRTKIENAFKKFYLSSPIPIEIDIVSFEELKETYTER